ncbi:MAG: hypothetical protein LBG43_07855 [Treponema sp.]|jgi:hypothetical protein|nr:hypothetical protein [Treponema sp.]
MNESAKLFAQETGISPAVPMRFYTWVKAENANRVQPDIVNSALDFEYDGSGGFLLKTIAQYNEIVSIWGNQILLQDENCRQLLFSHFVVTVCAFENRQDPLDISFKALGCVHTKEMRLGDR